MNTFVLLVAALVAIVAAEAVVSNELIEKINSSNAGWTAGKTSMSDLTVEEAKMYLGALPSSMSDAPVVSRHVKPLVGGPKAFNAFESFPNLSLVLKNQAKCGSCWAFSATSTLGYRFNIEGGNSTATYKDLSLSPQYPVSCDAMDLGCQGGNLPSVWSFMKNQGVPTMACQPYTSGAGQNGVCSTSSCTAPGQKFEKYYADNFYHVARSIFGVDAIKSEIVRNGPVQAAFTVYADFMSYTGGVYTHKSGAELGGHAITLVGFGNEDGKDYWLVQNSWGSSWGIDCASTGSAVGQKGCFKIDVNTCGISSDVYAGKAKVN